MKTNTQLVTLCFIDQQYTRLIPEKKNVYVHVCMLERIKIKVFRYKKCLVDMIYL